MPKKSEKIRKFAYWKTSNNKSAFMKIGILTAMTSEYDQLAALLEDCAECTVGKFKYLIGFIGKNEVVLRQCGIGKVNAAVGTAELIRSFAPNCIISTGVAGGIDKQLNVMDVVVSSSIVHHDVWCGMGCECGQVQGMPTMFTADKGLLETALSIETENETRIHSGLICTGDQFITSRTELDSIKGKFPAGLAVDMESAAIAQTCYIYNVPFISFRIISDTPGVDKHIQQYENFWGEMANRSFGITRKYLLAL
jgi:adenosylhomocysteine nucleosidase